jgi:hypothetical protein
VEQTKDQGREKQTALKELFRMRPCNSDRNGSEDGFDRKSGTVGCGDRIALGGPFEALPEMGDLGNLMEGNCDRRKKGSEKELQ